MTNESMRGSLGFTPIYERQSRSSVDLLSPFPSAATYRDSPRVDSELPSKSRVLPLRDGSAKDKPCVRQGMDRACDPDGYVNLRKEPQPDAPVVTKMKAGEPFSFQRKENETWCKVKLSSGVIGWMHYSRIKLYFTKDDLPGKPEKGDEIDEQASKQGINYYEVTQAAARGDKKALKTFFGFGGDGAAEEEHIGVMSVVIISSATTRSRSSCANNRENFARTWLSDGS